MTTARSQLGAEVTRATVWSHNLHANLWYHSSEIREVIDDVNINSKPYNDLCRFIMNMVGTLEYHSSEIREVIDDVNINSKPFNDLCRFIVNMVGTLEYQQSCSFNVQM